MNLYLRILFILTFSKGDKFMNNLKEFCVFCGEAKNLTTYKGTFICSDCYEKLKKSLKRDYYIGRLLFCVALSSSLAILEAVIVSLIMKFL